MSPQTPNTSPTAPQVSVSAPVIVQPAPNTAAYPTDARDVTGIQAYIRGAAGAAALRQNLANYQTYVAGQFGSWLLGYQGYHVDEPAPAPPAAKVARMSADGLGWDLVDSPVLSGPVPTYQKRADPTPNPTGFGTNPFALMGAGGGGTHGLLMAEVGGRATQSDGTVWLRIA